MSDNCWKECFRSLPTGDVITAIEYDASSNLLWVGYDCGRISSILENGEDDLFQEQPTFYSSFSSFRKTPVIELKAVNNGILAVSRNSFRIHSHGGCSLLKHNCFPFNNSASFSSADTLVHRQAGDKQENVPFSHVLIGSSDHNAYIYDINSYYSEPVMCFPTDSEVTCVKTSSQMYHAIGGFDGKIRLVDSRLRNNDIEKTLECCGGQSNFNRGGYVSGLSFHPDGYVLSCSSTISQTSNGWDAGYVPDSLVRLFDLRMMKQLTPLSLPISAPAASHFFTSELQSIEDYENNPYALSMEETSILLASQTGVVQVSAYSGNGVTNATSLLQVPLPFSEEAAMEPAVTAVTVSPSGHYIAMGCNDGSIIQYAHQSTLFHSDSGSVKRRITSWKSPSFGATEVLVQPAPYVPNGVEPLTVRGRREISLPHYALLNRYNHTISSSIRNMDANLTEADEEEYQRNQFRVKKGNWPSGNRFQHHALEDVDKKKTAVPPAFTRQSNVVLSSSYESVPQILMYSAEQSVDGNYRIANGLFQNCRKSGYISVLRNPGYAYPNSVQHLQQNALQCTSIPDNQWPPPINGLDLTSLPPLPYELSDPRISIEERELIKRVHYQNMYKSRHGDYYYCEAERGPGKPTGLSKGFGSTNSLPSAATSSTAGAKTISVTPSCYHIQRNSNKKSKFRANTHQQNNYYDLLNSFTTHHRVGRVLMGLENSYLPYLSYSNAIIQFLFAIPTIRANALAAQVSPYHHHCYRVNSSVGTTTTSPFGPPTLWCELGFLFHMLIQTDLACQSLSAKQASGSSTTTPCATEGGQGSSESGVSFGDLVNASQSNGVDRVVIPSSFQCAMRQSEVALASGLFKDIDTPSSSTTPKDTTPSTSNGAASTTTSTSTGLAVQLFCKFLLNELTKEREHELKMFPTSKQNTELAELFHFDVMTKNSFIRSKHEEVGPLSHMCCLELPAVPLSNASAAVNVSPKMCNFISRLWKSFRTENQMSGWCVTSKAFESFKQSKCVVNVPPILMILCGSDTDSSTVPVSPKTASVLSPLESSAPTSASALKAGKLPRFFEIAFCFPHDEQTGQAVVDSIPHVYVSVPVDATSDTSVSWVVYDGKKFSPPLPCPYSKQQDVADGVLTVFMCTLEAVVSEVTHSEESNVVLQVRNPATAGADTAIGVTDKQKESEWTLFNDYLIKPTVGDEVVDWDVMKQQNRRPCIIAYSSVCTSTTTPPDAVMDPVFVNGTSMFANPTPSSTSCLPVIPSSVLTLASLSAIPSIDCSNKFPDVDTSQPMQDEELIAFDAEFVSVELEKVAIDSNGRRTIEDEGRQIVARISLVLGGTDKEDGTSSSPASSETVIVDDYILPTDPILDYVTRFSGITESDLIPEQSRHALVTARTAYLKLRFFADRGCIFVGHGLKKDFETANIFVHPHQVRDTVELWRLPNQRKISLRFLAYTLLKASIQDDVHDSIEDAKTALRLYRHYQHCYKVGGLDHIHSIIHELYAFGNKTNWTIGGATVV